MFHDPPTCPASSAPCMAIRECHMLCPRLRRAPVDEMFDDSASAMAVHFVGFRGDEFTSTVRVWGQPDFVHRTFDVRVRESVADGDIVIFGPKADPAKGPSPFSFDDSNQADDPAAQER